MTAESNPFNYRYFVDHAARLGGRVLDYGCGIGQMIAEGRDRGLDIWGTDTFEGYYAAWSDGVPAQVRDRVRKIEGARADFPDGHFDVVLSNQVLEHVRDPEASIADMHRLLKPGGTLIASFPVTDTWYEGHVGLYFAHRLREGALRNAYFTLARKLGYGLYHKNVAPAEWARISEKTLDDVCIYYPRTRMRRAFERTFGAPVEDISVDYMRARLGEERAQKIPAAADGLLRFVYHKRAGEILLVKKPGSK